MYKNVFGYQVLHVLYISKHWFCVFGWSIQCNSPPEETVKIVPSIQILLLLNNWFPPFYILKLCQSQWRCVEIGDIYNRFQQIIYTLKWSWENKISETCPNFFLFFIFFWVIKILWWVNFLGFIFKPRNTVAPT